MLKTGMIGSGHRFFKKKPVNSARNHEITGLNARFAGKSTSGAESRLPQARLVLHFQLA
jgi:hypothetical protein